MRKIFDFSEVFAYSGAGKGSSADGGTFSRSKGLVGLISLGVASVALSVPAQAGFFDQLFGAPPPVSQPSYEYEQPLAPSIGDDAPLALPQARPARKASVEDRPVLQKTTDLMHDKTLRPGDAVMMKTGIHVYTGRETSTHVSSEFKPLDYVKKIKPSDRFALASMDVTRNDPLTKAMTPDTLASGRSASVATPVVSGVKFTDQRGKTIRYVGP